MSTRKLRVARILVAAAFLLVAAERLRAETLRVMPDGTGDFSTIQAALDAAAPGDVILLGSGVFTGEGNRNLNFLGKTVTVRSESGHAADCVIDPQGIPWIPSRAFDFRASEGHDSIVRDLTIRNGTTDDC